MRRDFAAVNPGLATSWRVQKNPHSPTAPPMAAKIGYTCARERGRDVVSRRDRLGYGDAREGSRADDG